MEVPKSRMRREKVLKQTLAELSSACRRSQGKC